LTSVTLYRENRIPKRKKQMETTTI